MATCPMCGTRLQTVEEAAEERQRTDRAIRYRLAGDQLPGAHLGHTAWVITPEAPADAGNGHASAACPVCGGHWYSVSKAAILLRRSPSRLYAVLGTHPERLHAVRVGRHWLIPESGIKAYRDWLAQRQKVLTALAGGDGRLTEVVLRQRQCRCAGPARSPARQADSAAPLGLQGVRASRGGVGGEASQASSAAGTDQ